MQSLNLSAIGRLALMAVTPAPGGVARNLCNKGRLAAMARPLVVCSRSECCRSECEDATSHGLRVGDRGVVASLLSGWRLRHEFDRIDDGAVGSWRWRWSCKTPQIRWRGAPAGPGATCAGGGASEERMRSSAGWLARRRWRRRRQWRWGRRRRGRGS
ncbi:hypothetical protein PAHAL_9G363000 [Panicum hallii]|uniref:Uncharacterized protein n=1 Tax=Panicum hallii TaxID=206008 RepID=A0A2T8I3Q0_9POAL|nr:hypothetical protein PAHAL_9G363000 [Panicum hallii]